MFLKIPWVTLTKAYFWNFDQTILDPILSTTLIHTTITIIIMRKRQQRKLLKSPRSRASKSTVTTTSAASSGMFRCTSHSGSAFTSLPSSSARLDVIRSVNWNVKIKRAISFIIGFLSSSVSFRPQVDLPNHYQRRSLHDMTHEETVEKINKMTVFAMQQIEDFKEKYL